MKRSAGIALCMAVLACGPNEELTPATPGVSVSNELIAEMSRGFNRIAADSGSDMQFSELSVTFVIPFFDAFGMTGRVTAPNKIEQMLPVYRSDWEDTATFLLLYALSVGTPPFPPGVGVSEELVSLLEYKFYETKACGSFTDGEFSELAVRLTVPETNCTAYPEEGCGGQFKNPNAIELGWIELAEHEYIHFLLWRNGFPDENHQDIAFLRCALW